VQVQEGLEKPLRLLGTALLLRQGLPPFRALRNSIHARSIVGETHDVIPFARHEVERYRFAPYFPINGPEMLMDDLERFRRLARSEFPSRMILSAASLQADDKVMPTVERTKCDTMRPNGVRHSKQIPIRCVC
jgi:hypothetical protein